MSPVRTFGQQHPSCTWCHCICFRKELSNALVTHPKTHGPCSLGLSVCSLPSSVTRGCDLSLSSARSLVWHFEQILAPRSAPLYFGTRFCVFSLARGEHPKWHFVVPVCGDSNALAISDCRAVTVSGLHDGDTRLWSSWILKPVPKASARLCRPEMLGSTTRFLICSSWSS